MPSTQKDIYKPVQHQMTKSSPHQKSTKKIHIYRCQQKRILNSLQRPDHQIPPLLRQDTLNPPHLPRTRIANPPNIPGIRQERKEMRHDNQRSRSLLLHQKYELALHHRRGEDQAPENRRRWFLRRDGELDGAYVAGSGLVGFFDP